MNKFILKFKDTFFSKQFFIFVTIGIINTFIGVVFSYIFSSFLNENIAFVVGYICGLFVSYLLNSFFTFKEILDFNKFVKFAISYIPNFIIQNIVVLIVFNMIGLHKLIAYVLAAIIGVPVTFVLMKFFAFKQKEE
ncbi:GtrA family protein [Clostridium cagae]|uniref:GtrA family protein n=1 Tax=Clostridium cagae TaxID=2080751 RepID=UPI003F75ECF9